MPNRPNIRVENDPVKRMRELREFCLRNAPKGYYAKCSNPFDIDRWSWTYRVEWTRGPRTIANICFNPSEKSIFVHWSEHFEQDAAGARERAALIHAVADFAYALSEFWKDWNTKYWPQKPGRRIVEALAESPSPEGTR